MGLFTRLRRGPVAGELTTQLNNEGGRGIIDRLRGRKTASSVASRAPDGLTNAEVSVLISIDDTIAHRDQRRGRKLVKGQRALVNAAHRSVAATDQLTAARADPRWVNGGLIDSTAQTPTAPADSATPPPAAVAAVESPRRRWRRGRTAHRSGTDLSTFREMFDPNKPLIGERPLLVVEVIFVIVEFFFWYGVFSENVEAGAGPLDSLRVSDILLAVILPLSGVVAARVVGSLGHRVASRYPGIGWKERFGFILASLVAILALFAIFSLVHERFAHPQPGAIALPATAMTLVFVVVLLGDMVARIFMVSEIRIQTEKWLRHLDRLKARAIEANRAHAEAWLGLRNDTQVQLDRCERIVATGARIISDLRSRNGIAAPTQVTAATRTIRAAHATEDELAVFGAMAVPSVAQMELYGVRLALGPIRVVSDAVNTLRQFPPRDQPALETYLVEILTQLYRVAPNKVSDQPKPDAADPENGDGSLDSPGSEPIDGARPDRADDVSTETGEPVDEPAEDGAGGGWRTTTMVRPRPPLDGADDDATRRISADQDAVDDPPATTGGMSTTLRLGRLNPDEPVTEQVDGVDPLATGRHNGRDRS